MTQETENSGPALDLDLRPLLRAVMAGLLLVPGASKFLTYGDSVRFFESLGLPGPAVLVPVVGGVELVVAVLLLLDRYPRLAALTIVPVMLVAAVTAGPTWQNIAVLIGAVALVGLDTPEVARFR
jgi:putative oxidoreductase